ncbi:hypothetical protein GCM10011411_21940 [Aurantiacibacter arachoides]|nr:hypothetical protein GCM10011411_21940 [Aurantiacibacter arachoides]
MIEDAETAARPEACRYKVLGAEVAADKDELRIGLRVQALHLQGNLLSIARKSAGHGATAVVWTGCPGACGGKGVSLRNRLQYLGRGCVLAIILRLGRRNREGERRNSSDGKGQSGTRHQRSMIG